MTPKIYLDIDGVLLAQRHKKAADGSVELIDFIVNKFDCYWLTTHCRDGHTDGLIKMLSEYYSDDVIKKISMIKPTDWDALKTEAIDFNSHFFWLDDYVFEAEKAVLLEKNCAHSLILVNLGRKNELLDIIQHRLA